MKRLVNRPFDYNNRFRCTYVGPVYRFGQHVKDVSLSTTASSKDKARSNIFYKARLSIGLTGNAIVCLDESRLCFEDRLLTYRSTCLCDQCGERLNDDDSCPYCDHGDSKDK